MALDNSVKNLIGNLFRIDNNLTFFTPGYLASKKATEENLPWLGLKNLNRVVYFVITFFFFFETIIADITIALDAKQKEPIIIEVKDNFTNLIKLEKLGFLQSKIENIPVAQMIVLKDIYKFIMSTKYDKFNLLFENDPNIKLLAKHSGNLSAPIFLENSEVYEYYEKAAKQIFGK